MITLVTPHPCQFTLVLFPGALSVHELVPGILRGVSLTGRTKPALSRRCAAVAAAASEQLRGQASSRSSEEPPPHEMGPG